MLIPNYDRISETEILNTAIVNSRNVSDEIWEDIKINLGIYKNGDEDFFVWTEEVDANEQLNTESKELLENIINEHEQVIDIISFR